MVMNWILNTYPLLRVWWPSASLCPCSLSVIFLFAEIRLQLSGSNGEVVSLYGYYRPDGPGFKYDKWWLYCKCKLIKVAVLIDGKFELLSTLVLITHQADTIVQWFCFRDFPKIAKLAFITMLCFTAVDVITVMFYFISPSNSFLTRSRKNR